MNETFMKEQPIFPLIVSMALPMVISMLVNSLYNIIDSFFVAQISENAMTALSLVYPVQNLINAIAVGFGIGVNAMIAFYLGANDKKLANVAASHGFLLSILHGIVVTVSSICFMPTFLQFFTSSKDVIDCGLEYSRIAFSFSVIIMIGLFFEKFFQAMGQMKISMFAMMCGCVTNIILDPLLIFGIGFFPRMGIKGAALATGIGQISTLMIYLVIYFVGDFPVKISSKCFCKETGIDKKLYAIGIPATLNMAMPSLLISCLNGLLAAFSQSYVVVLGIYYKLQTFLYLPANGIIQGMRPVIGYNYGAREYNRVQNIYKVTLLMSGSIMAFGTILCLLYASPLLELFTNNPATIEIGTAALRIICGGFIVSAVSVTSSGALEGLGKGMPSLVISLFRYILVIIPAAFLLIRFGGPDAIWHAFWITEVITAIISVVVYRRTIK